MLGFDTGFSLIPGDDELTADQRLEATLKGLVPSQQPDVPRPLGRGWAFDWATGQFVSHGNAPAAVSGVQQVRMWVEKTLRTARLAHLIYSDEYGTDDPFSEVGKQFTPALAGMVARRVSEALLVHDRITAVKDFEFQGGPSEALLVVEFTVVLDQEEIAFSHTVGARSS